MANKPMSPVSPVETRAEAFKRLKRLKHRLFWLHPIGFAIAILASGGDIHRMRTYVKVALTITITAHILWAFQMVGASRLYGRKQG